MWTRNISKQHASGLFNSIQVAISTIKCRCSSNTHWQNIQVMRGYVCNFVAGNYMAISCNRNSQHGVSYLCLTCSGDENNNVKSSKLHNYASQSPFNEYAYNTCNEIWLLYDIVNYTYCFLYNCKKIIVKISNRFLQL